MRQRGCQNLRQLRYATLERDGHVSIIDEDWSIPDALTLFGLAAVVSMLVCYACEDRHPGFVLGFACACAAGSAYGFLQGAWPFGLVEAVWSVVALRRWLRARRRAPGA